MKKILIIDDDPQIQEYLVSLFEDHVPEGLKIAKEVVPDLITLDLDMPGEWGPRFYRKMSQIDELKNIPVVVISGISGSDYAIGKAVASLSKPFDRNELLNIVKENL